MKEDKSDEWIASSLKKHLEEGKLPYEEGAWEEFSRLRNGKQRREKFYWISGVAASLLVLLAVSQVFLGGNSGSVEELSNTDLISEQIKNPEENIADADSGNSNKREFSEEKSIPQTQNSDGIERNVPSKEASPSTNNSFDKQIAKTEKKESFSQNLAKESKNESIKEESKKTEDVKVERKEENAENSLKSGLVAASKENNSESVDSNNSGVIINTKEEKPLLATAETEDFPEIPKESTKVKLGMGVSPGFGAIQQDNTNTTASSIGVGMLLDVDLPGKLTIGSGFGVNYMNQQNESQMPVTIAGYRTSQMEKQDIQQIQLELPVYFKYPITRSNSISVQAGFSNLYAINQNAEQLTTVNEQVAVNNFADSSTAFALSSTAVSQTEVLSIGDNKFYPFATLNFGVNIRLIESKKVNYLVMPFYNHQLRTISGFGGNFGMFGASLKLNFGGSEK